MSVLHRLVTLSMGALALGAVAPGTRASAADGSLVEPHAAPSAGMGYVAALLQIRSREEQVSVGLKDAAGREYSLALVRTRDAWPASEVARMIALPPGDYRMAFWTYGINRHAIAVGDRYATPFAVRPGHTVFLGFFVADEGPGGGPTISRSLRGSDTSWAYSISAATMRADEVWDRLRVEYPAFAKAPIECFDCRQTRSDSPVRPALPGDGDFTAAGDVTIHLHRAAGGYGDLRLLAWESFEGTQDRRMLTSASTFAPMPPSGVDAFGARWTLKGREFLNGRVNFALQEGNERLPSGDRGWDMSRGRSAWLVDGDPRIYSSSGRAVVALGGSPATRRWLQALDEALASPVVDVEGLIARARKAGEELLAEAARAEAEGTDSGGALLVVDVEGLRIQAGPPRSAEPDLAYFGTLVPKAGRPADAAFLAMSARTRPDGSAPVYAEPNYDGSKFCTRLEPAKLPAIYAGWLDFRRRYPGAYAGEVAIELANLDAALARDCACGKLAETVAGLKALVKVLPPRGPAGTRARAVLQDLRTKQPRFQVECRGE